jgi:hypothetical protein
MSEDRLTPAYVPFKTLAVLLEDLEQGIPSHIDRSVLPTKSGSAISQITSSMRFLGLIEEDGTTTPLLEQLVYASEAESKKTVWIKVLQSAYPYLFEDGFDLATAPPSQLEQRFRDYGGVSGSTVRRCILFFVGAAMEAGIPLSNYIKGYVKRKPNGSSSSRSKPRPKKTSQDEVEPEESKKHQSPQQHHPATTVPPLPRGPEVSIKAKMLEKMTDKFPAYDPTWEPEVQAKWFEAFTNFNQQIMSLEDSNEE